MTWLKAERATVTQSTRSSEIVRKALVDYRSQYRALHRPDHVLPLDGGPRVQDEIIGHSRGDCARGLNINYRRSGLLEEGNDPLVGNFALSGASLPLIIISG